MHILIIDDTQADHDLIVDYLGSTGGDYQLYHAYSADEGLKIFSLHPIDCVLLDYRMPGTDGLEVLKLLTDQHSMIPVIMMTGEGNEFVAVTAMKLGSQDYIPKKILTSSALKRAVERAVERAAMLRQMEKYRSDLERSNQDLEQFANIVAHDLKSPLRAVTQHLTLLRSKNEELLDENSHRSLEFAVEGAARMRQLIDALFEYARLGFSEAKFDEVSLNDVLENTLHDLSSLINERKAEITYGPLPSVWGDGILLTQLMQNLIANAIKYSKDTPKIEISTVNEGSQWRISVRDHGIGIPPSQHRQIFFIFRRLHTDEYPGIGLGLAICDRIVKRHGGSISVESVLGEGSNFHIVLPALADAHIHQEKVSYG